MFALHLYVGWSAILAGLLAGTLLGLGFHGEDWLGGYHSWRRRLLRLAHISLVGTGLLNVAFAVSLPHLHFVTPPKIASVAFIIGAITMPSVCLLAAWQRPCRHLFFVPVSSLILAVLDLLWGGMLR